MTRCVLITELHLLPILSFEHIVRKSHWITVQLSNCNDKTLLCSYINYSKDRLHIKNITEFMWLLFYCRGAPTQSWSVVGK